MSTCRSCGAEILWARTESGSAIPLDPDPEKRFVIATDGVDPEIALLRNTFESHFATCPDAEEWRET